MITRASDALYDSLCPGRALAQFAVGPTVEEEPSDDAKFGITIHEALAKNDLTNLTREQADIFESCGKILTSAVTKYLGIDAPLALSQALREREYSINFTSGNHHMGHPDVVIRSGSKAMIPDFKTLPGQHDDAADNMQLRDYVVLVDTHCACLQEIATVIIQPLVTHEPQICVYGRKEIEQARRELFKRLDASANPMAPRLPGNLQCKWCRAKQNCREYQSWIGEKLPIPKNIMDVPVAEWTPTQCAIFLNNRAAAAKWLEETEESIRERVEKNPTSVPGWGLKDGNPVEILTNIDLIYQRFTNLGGTHEEFMECLRGVKIKSKLKELVAKHTEQKGMKLNETMKRLTDGASEWHQNRPSLYRIKNDTTQPKEIE
jgi:hypothetical protein